jgi:hypothetical protein
MTRKPLDDNLEEFTSPCAECNVKITLKWDNGLIPEAHYVLIADWVYHTECWDKIVEAHPPRPPEGEDFDAFIP